MRFQQPSKMHRKYKNNAFKLTNHQVKLIQTNYNNKFKQLNKTY